VAAAAANLLGGEPGESVNESGSANMMEWRTSDRGEQMEETTLSSPDERLSQMTLVRDDRRTLGLNQNLPLELISTRVLTNRGLRQCRALPGQ